MHCWARWTATATTGSMIPVETDTGPQVSNKTPRCIVHGPCSSTTTTLKYQTRWSVSLVVAYVANTLETGMNARFGAFGTWDKSDDQRGRRFNFTDNTKPLSERHRSYELTEAPTSHYPPSLQSKFEEPCCS